jgi:hypothetical protein
MFSNNKHQQQYQQQQYQQGGYYPPPPQQGEFCELSKVWQTGREPTCCSKTVVSNMLLS